ncbi:MAG: hypothetical protein ACE5JU_10570 [Candidatus Binatia bacterium]
MTWQDLHGEKGVTKALRNFRLYSIPQAHPTTIVIDKGKVDAPIPQAEPHRPVVTLIARTALYIDP